MKNGLLLVFGCLILSLNSCKEKEVEPTEENELITTVKLNFENSGIIKTFKYSDPDGDGGAAPTIDKVTLDANKVYNLTIELLDESKSPAKNISEEVSEEADEHLFIYTPTPSGLLTYTYSDKDSKNLAVGLVGKILTNTPGSGKLKVQLRHQPPVGGVATKNGTATPGSDDINIDFDVEVK
jgi:hypothetical protein